MTGNAYYVTTAIAYPNGEPHIGHAYELIATDAIARWRRLEGREVYFLTGTDEHGIKMVQTAEREGLTPRALADRNSARFQRTGGAARRLQRRFHPDHGARHAAACQELWRTAVEQGRRHLPVDLQGLVLGARRSLFRRRRTDDRRGRQEVRAVRRRGDMGRGAELFLPPLGLPGPAAEALRGPTRTSSRPRSGATRSSRSSKAASRISRSHGRRSTGASRSRTRRAT